MSRVFVGWDAAGKRIHIGDMVEWGTGRGEVVGQDESPERIVVRRVAICQAVVAKKCTVERPEVK